MTIQTTRLTRLPRRLASKLHASPASRAASQHKLIGCGATAGLVTGYRSRGHGASSDIAAVSSHATAETVGMQVDHIVSEFILEIVRMGSCVLQNG